MTELFINSQLIEDIDAEIAMTLSSFKLDSLGTRKGSFSNVFDLPKTNQTRLLFENCELVTSVTDIPYQLNACQIFIDGQLVVDGSAVIRETKDNYKVFISAGNSDFFKAIASLKIKDVSLSQFNHEYNIEQVTIRRESEQGFVYPNIDYGFFENQSIIFWNSQTVVNRERFFQPSMWIYTILENALQDIGYTLTGDLINAESYTNGVVLCRAASVPLEALLVNYRLSNVSLLDAFIDGTTLKLSFDEKIIDINDLYVFNNTAGIDQAVYTPGSTDKENFVLQIFFEGTVTTQQGLRYRNRLVFVDLLVYDEDGTLEATFTQSERFGIIEVGFTEQIRLSFSFDSPAIQTLLENTPNIQNLRFGWQLRSEIDADGLVFSDLEFSINQVPKASGQIGTVKDIIASSVLPQNVTVGDLLITLSIIEGIIFQVDESKKIVNTDRIDKLIKNKGIALDWSDKIDLTDDEEVFYSIDTFAQNNLYQFAKDDKDIFLPENIGQGVIQVLNENLEREKVLFESKFAPVPVLSTFQGSYTMGKVFTGDKYVFDGVNFVLNQKLTVEEFTPRIAILTKSTSNLLQVDSQQGLQQTFNWVVNPISLNFSRSIFNHYKLVRSVVINTKVVKALFLLDLEDIVNLDFTRPVFIDYFGEFFYIESIDQFKVNKRESCFVKLVRI